MRWEFVYVTSASKINNIILEGKNSQKNQYFDCQNNMFCSLQIRRDAGERTRKRNKSYIFSVNNKNKTHSIIFRCQFLNVLTQLQKSLSSLVRQSFIDLSTLIQWFRRCHFGRCLITHEIKNLKNYCYFHGQWLIIAFKSNVKRKTTPSKTVIRSNS